MARIRIGEFEAPARVSGSLDGELLCEFQPTREAARLLRQAVPGARAIVVIDGAEYPGRVRISDPDEFVTAVEF